MKVLCWSLVAAMGLAIMAWAYFGYIRLDAKSPCSTGAILLSPGPGDEPRLPSGFKRIAVTVRELPPGPIAVAVINALGAQGESRRRSLAAQLSEKLVRLEPKDVGIDAKSLRSGRMPRAGHDEVLAGWQTSASNRLSIAGREFSVVGVLQRDVALLVDCYVVPPHPAVAAVFDPHDATTHPAFLVVPPGEKIRDYKVREELRSLVSSKQYATVVPMVRTDRGPYYLYMAGETVLLWGGSLALIAIYRLLSPRIGWNVLHDPLAELAARPRVLGTLHLVYFGVLIAASLVVYEFPSLQKAMLPVVSQSFSDPQEKPRSSTSQQNHLPVASQSSSKPQSPLVAVAKAYHSLSIVRAAAMTFVVNFFFGSAAVITLPSLIVPGSGALMAVVRAAAWGMLLAPAFVIFSSSMLAHSITLLLEGEGYILAAFFGLLMPLYLFDHNQGPGVWRRYGRALLMNLKAMLLVAIVLLAAACYEATEVILMIR